MTSVLFFTSCEKEEFEVTVQASPVQTAHQVRKISFGELKRNRSAFETLKKSRSKLKASSLLHRGVYSDDFGVFIDTTTILVTEKDGKHSITFRILNEEEVFKIKNLVLNAKEDGSYKAYITEYILSQAELTKLANNEPIGEKYPSAVTDVSTYSRFSIEGDGAGCIEVRTYTVRYCNNSSGQTIVNTGTNGGNSSDCYNGFYEVEYQTIIIYAGCLSDGGGGGGNNPGGDIPGYNPGDGNGNSGGGSSSGGNTGNPDPGNNGNPTDPNQNLNDGHTPIITTPVLTIDKREVRLYNQLNASQQAWWNSAPAETKNALLDYFNQNSPNNVVTDEAMAFILELINDYINFPTAEGEDGGDEFKYDDYSNIQTQTQTLPGRNAFYAAFPKVGAAGMPSPQVYQLIGGHPYQAHLADNPNYQNACALRVSRALNYTGRTVSVFKNNNNNEQKTEKGSDNLNYILDAASLLAYMKKTFPNSQPIHLIDKTPIEIKSALQGKWGIYIMIPKDRGTFGATGHADFWSNTGCLSGCYFDKAKEVYFWELF